MKKRKDTLQINVLGFNRNETLEQVFNGQDLTKDISRHESIDWDDTLSKKLYFTMKCNKQQAFEVANGCNIKTKSVTRGVYGFTVARNKSLRKIKQAFERVGLDVETATIL